MCNIQEERKGDRKVTLMVNFLSTVVYSDPSSTLPPGIDQTGSCEVSSSSSPHSLFSFALSSLSASLQQTLSRALQYPLLSIFLLSFPQSAKSLSPLCCLYFLSVVPSPLFPQSAQSFTPAPYLPSLLPISFGSPPF